MADWHPITWALLLAWFSLAWHGGRWAIRLLVLLVLAKAAAHVQKGGKP